MSKGSVITAAMNLVGQKGASGLTMSDVARAMGVSQPALYSHFANLQALLAAVTSRATELLQTRLLSAVRDNPQTPVEALIHAYRSYTREFPDLYLLQTRGTRDPDPEIAAHQQARAAQVGDITLLALTMFGVQEQVAAQVQFALRAAMHGYGSLEARARAVGREHSTIESRSAQRWDPDQDGEFDTYVQLIVSGLKFFLP